MKERRKRFANFNPRLLIMVGIIALVITGSAAALLTLVVSNLTIVAALHQPQGNPLDQFQLLNLVKAGKPDQAFDLAFETGDTFFGNVFNALDGVGANVGIGLRFTRVPRADLNGPGEWANHIPKRPTGPNAQSCFDCHRTPIEDGGSPAVDMNMRDPFHLARLDAIITRQAPPFFGSGALQRLAEEMTASLKQIRDAAVSEACTTGSSTKPLVVQGVSFGTIKATRTSTNPCKTTVDTSGVVGVSPDLIIRPFEWKGINFTLRDFVRGASNNELGMQPVELTGLGVDGDFDGIVNEASVGDETSLAVYTAAQPRPVTQLELDALGLLDTPLSSIQIDSINHGAQVFNQIGCTVCHVPTLKLKNPIFSEPSQSADFRDATFPAGQNPIAEGVDPAFPVSFDLTKDQPDNIVFDANGNIVTRLGSFQVDANGLVIVNLYGDLKRHEMGAGLAETIDEAGTGPSNFQTENLWGVGSTPPYLHDGRATTLTEAILEHGGEAQAANDAFQDLGLQDQKDLIAFLNNLILFSPTTQIVIGQTPTPTPTPTATPTPTPTLTPTPTPTSPLRFSLSYTVANDWGTGATINMVLTNLSSVDVNGWTIKWNFPGNQRITDDWGGISTQSGNAVTIKNESYNPMLTANGGQAFLGINFSYTGSNAKPVNITVNGVPVQ